jgi:hypothetical protein
MGTAALHFHCLFVILPVSKRGVKHEQCSIVNFGFGIPATIPVLAKDITSQECEM